MLGATEWRFETTEFTFAQWERLVSDLIQTEGDGALFLKRGGGLCGPRHRLEPSSTFTIGRASPQGSPEWSLDGLFDHERKHIAYRHAQLRPLNKGWELCPLTDRHRVFVNRVPISQPTRLDPGDEVALGSVLFHFHYPDGGEAPWRRNLLLPSLVDWTRDGEAPKTSAPPKTSATTKDRP
jgi:hypothetical protein